MSGNILVLFGILIIFIGFLIIIAGMTFGASSGLEQERYYSYEKESNSEKEDYLKNAADFEKRTDSGRNPSGSDFERKKSSKIKGAGVIMLGPIPIIFGSDGESAKTAIILAILMMLLTLIMFRGSFF
ncbi:TIGR00304 family membrane protein [Methanosarcina sp. Mfa9]|uniref:TIGR00304 family membrane protein n=1 Tax=Methanosarcina sp. Mfa9 TaxID=3439063 RepID=UPI003F8293BE